MDNPIFIDEEDIPLINQDEDDCRTPDTSRIDEASFRVPDTTEAKSTLRLSQEVKRDKINALYIHLNVTGKPTFNRFRSISAYKGSKKRSHNF